MAFRLATDRRFTADVLIRSESFAATFRVLSDAELAAHDFETREGQQTFLRAAITEVSGVLDADGTPIPSSPQLLDEMLGYSDLRFALLSAHTKGFLQAKTGN
ncbi:hypothetical protein ACFSDD_09230 [Salipiger marinus]|uniref:hypothetical protein n=1 Tax=Salipiger marinus TaxID=555512 RepID=UPI002BBE54E0|nr:hypothetical protein [Salipiger manganoxidans]MEB3421879.1 hypothetical protein [Salipiger manganoxidans]